MVKKYINENNSGVSTYQNLPISPRLGVFFFQAEDGIRAGTVTGVQTCALPISGLGPPRKNQELSATILTIRERRKTSRSEERRVGKECRSRWSLYHLKIKNRKRMNQPHITFAFKT